MQIRFADFYLDTAARQLFQGSREIHLSPKAFELLKVLVENRPRAIAKNELLEKIWPGVFVSDASLARGISEIRDAIQDHSRSDGFVQTVHAYGYRFANAGVEEVRGAAAVTAGAGPVCWLLGRNLEFRLQDGQHLIGREPGVSVRLDSPKVSRHHARVTVKGRVLTIEDLSSKNGTFVRGARVTSETVVNPGDEIQVGPIALVFKVAEVPASTETEIWGRDSM